MPRIRKAWMYRVKGYDGEGSSIYGQTASKARYQAWTHLVDCCPDLKLIDVSVRRDPARDMVLPDEHRLVAELTTAERKIVSHAYGGDARQPGYRDHYCTAPGDRALLRLTFELGIFEGPFGEKGYGETPGWSGAFFHLTALGREIARSMLPTYPG